MIPAVEFDSPPHPRRRSVNRSARQVVNLVEPVRIWSVPLGYVSMVVRSASKNCHWCGVTLCHKCRHARYSIASCGGNPLDLCERASTRDHLIPRKEQPNRRMHSGYKNPPPIVIACRTCNNERGGMSVDEWDRYRWAKWLFDSHGPVALTGRAPVLQAGGSRFESE